VRRVVSNGYAVSDGNPSSVGHRVSLPYGGSLASIAIEIPPTWLQGQFSINLAAGSSKGILALVLCTAAAPRAVYRLAGPYTEIEVVLESVTRVGGAELVPAAVSIVGRAPDVASVVSE